jgi:hypothetical protein
VIVYETDEGQSVVSIVNPVSMLGVVEKEDLNSVANEANARLTRVVKKLAEKSTSCVLPQTFL